MKKKIKKSVGPRAETQKNSKSQDQGAAGNEAYRQINSKSFQHNFKILIGNYKQIGENAEAV